MRILIVGSVAASLVNFRGDLIKEFVRRGHTVFAAAPPGARNIDDELSSWGAIRITLKLARTGSNPLADLRLLLSLRRAIRTSTPDLVVAYTIKPVIYGAIAARWARVPRFAAMVTGLGFAFSHTTTFAQAVVGTTARVMYRLAMRYTSDLLFQNVDDEEEFRRQGFLKYGQSVTITHGSGVNLQRFQRARLPDGPLSFLMVSRLIGDKGVREYLEAAAIVRRIRPDIECKLVGPYDTHPSAISGAEISAAVSAGDVIYCGATSDVAPFLRDCHVYVLPSYREGTPRSVLEAMAVGRPIVTTDVPGCRETVISGENGLMVPPRSGKKLAEAMIYMLSLSATELQRMANASRHLAETKFDVTSVNSKICSALCL